MSDTTKILQNLKNLKNIEAYVFDIDGTIKSPLEPDCKPLELIKFILLKDKFVILITSSGISARLGIIVDIQNMLKENNFDDAVYVGIANGMAMYEITKEEIKELYNFSLTKDEISIILKAYDKIIENYPIISAFLIKNGINTFNNKRDWNGLLSNDFIEYFKTYQGNIFIESLKVSFVMPENKIFTQDVFISQMQKELNNLFGKEKCIIDKGDNVFAHVTLFPNKIQPKAFALFNFIHDFSLDLDQVIVFGDMPEGNDRELLTFGGPSFTNAKVRNFNFNLYPSCILENYEKTPIKSVYDAVHYLLGDVK
jgi:hydroxymethylpyrimidine pyrophosphatase-like HAD family hydrolase